MHLNLIRLGFIDFCRHPRVSYLSDRIQDLSPVSIDRRSNARGTIAALQKRMTECFSHFFRSHSREKPKH